MTTGLTFLRQSIFLVDDEIARLIPMPAEKWRAVAAALEKSNRGMPAKDPLFGNRRCWPAVRRHLIGRASARDDVRAEFDNALYLTEKQTATKLSMTLAEWKTAATTLERVGLPFRDPLFDSRRCWPVVRAFLCDHAGGHMHKVPRPAPTGSGERVFLKGEVPYGFRSAGRRGRKAGAPARIVVAEE
jgi:hypothetical protein